LDATVGSFGSRTEAELARQLLASAGIDAWLRADDAAGLHPELGQVGMYRGITLVVTPDDLDDAREVLASVAAEPDDWDEPARPTGGSREWLLLLVGVVVVAVLIASNVTDLWR
jgi:hypothetical protein